MRVVVTGATGNVGSSVVEALSRDERIAAIVGLARRPTDWAPPKTQLRTVDVATDDLAPHFAGADAVVHLAWLFQPTHRPMVTWKANALGSIRVFEAAVRAGASALVYASSVGAYSPGPPDDAPVDESWPTHSIPTAAYGREKAYVERALDSVEHEHPELRVVRLRPAFIFKRASSNQQRRLFAGPLLPNPLVRPGRLPVLPIPAGLRFQALHSRDAAEAYRLAVTTEVRGAFNVAAEPVLDGAELARVLGARPVTVPRALVRGAVAAAWTARVVPTDPTLLDLVLGLPVMDTTRARRELGWSPRFGADEALRELLEGMADGAGGRTPPLAQDDASQRVDDLPAGVS